MRLSVTFNLFVNTITNKNQGEYMNVFTDFFKDKDSTKKIFAAANVIEKNKVHIEKFDPDFIDKVLSINDHAMDRYCAT